MLKGGPSLPPGLSFRKLHGTLNEEWWHIPGERDFWTIKAGVGRNPELHKLC